MKIVGNWVRLDALHIHYFLVGNGDSHVILLHGGGTNSAMLSWGTVLSPLSQEHTIYAPDWPSYGKSSTFHGKYTTEMLIDCLGKLIDAWKLQRVSLVGISMGGCAALGYALTYPEKVDRVVLAGSYGIQEKAPYHIISYLLLHMPFFCKTIWAGIRKSQFLLKQCLSRIIYDAETITDELLYEVFQMAQRSCIEKAFFSWLRNEVLWKGMKTCYANRYREVQAKTLLIHGEYDPLIPVSHACRAAMEIPGAQLHIVKNCGHWVTREKTDEFNEVVKSFLEDIPPNKFQ